MKDERRDRESLLEDFKKLGLKNKRLKNELKGRKGNPNKRIKLTENTQKDLEEARKQAKEQCKLTNIGRNKPKSLGVRWPGKDKYGKTSTRRI